MKSFNERINFCKRFLVRNSIFGRFVLYFVRVFKITAWNRYIDEYRRTHVQSQQQGDLDIFNFQVSCQSVNLPLFYFKNTKVPSLLNISIRNSNKKMKDSFIPTSSANGSKKAKNKFGS
jgi:hypothetical protein